jgi:hypothetical protein
MSAVDFIPYVIGGGQLSLLLAIFLRLGRIGRTLEEHDRRLTHLEESPLAKLA